MGVEVLFVRGARALRIQDSLKHETSAGTGKSKACLFIGDEGTGGDNLTMTTRSASH